MKLLTTLFIASFTLVSAQEVKIEKQTELAPSIIEQVTTNPVSNKILLPFLYDDRSIVKKKSYKNIIEKTLSGENHLVFKIKRSTKTC